MAIDIKNLLKRTRVFNLETDPYLLSSKNGKGNPSSITFLPLETKVGLSECILECEEVHNALYPKNKKARPSLRIMKRYRNSTKRVLPERKSSKKKKKDKKKKK